jgi:magnesium transporter
MLTAYPASGHAEASAAARDVSWLDLVNPTNEEEASVESRYGLKLPSRQELSEVESSSRVSEKNGVLFLNMPTVSHMSGLDEAPSPVGFVLSKDLLVTIRYTNLRSFETVAEKFSKDVGPATSIETFAVLVDEIVDLSADLLEEIAAELDAISRTVFAKLARQTHVTRSNDKLRDLLITIGNAGARLSRISDSVLSLQRIVLFVSGTERDWIPKKMRDHLSTPQNDLLSLTEYETHLSDKVQFLLDAVLGFVNTRQNDIFQVLTVISLVGIPPTLVASIYGMNFKNMPELTWAWGYQYGLAVIVLSAVLPILWFKWRRWL